MTKKSITTFLQGASQYKAYVIAIVTVVAIMLAVSQGQGADVLKHWYQSLTGVTYQAFEPIYGYDYAREVVKEHLTRKDSTYKTHPVMDDEITRLKKSDTVWHYRFSRDGKQYHFRLQEQKTSSENAVASFHIQPID